MKKVFALLVAVAMIVSIAPMAMAKNWGHYVDYVGDEVDFGDAYGPFSTAARFDLGNLIYALEIGSGDDAEEIEVAEDDEDEPEFIRLTIDEMVANGLLAFTYTQKQVKADKLGVEVRQTNGRRVVDNAEIKYADTFSVPDYVWPSADEKEEGEGIAIAGDGDENAFFRNIKLPNDLRIAYVQVNFFDKLFSVDDVDYEFTIYLTEDKRRVVDSAVKCTGNFDNDRYEVNDSDVEAWLARTSYRVIDSNAYIPKMAIELDAGVVINTRLYNNRSYYAFAEAKLRGDDMDLIEKHNLDIVEVYHLETINLENSFTTVKLNDAPGSAYVYNSKLELLGMGNDSLPYASAYYVSVNEIEVEVDDEPEDDDDFEDDDFEDDGETGGDDFNNVNDNPGTGC